MLFRIPSKGFFRSFLCLRDVHRRIVDPPTLFMGKLKSVESRFHTINTPFFTPNSYPQEFQHLSGDMDGSH